MADCRRRGNGRGRRWTAWRSPAIRRLWPARSTHSFQRLIDQPGGVVQVHFAPIDQERAELRGGGRDDVEEPIHRRERIGCRLRGRPVGTHASNDVLELVEPHLVQRLPLLRTGSLIGFDESLTQIVDGSPKCVPLEVDLVHASPSSQSAQAECRNERAYPQMRVQQGARW
ncbi:MAG TPA: hypothetical protein VKB55_00595 [Nocardioidaceae bacterium]|nr:hypothetical protein [Nocardioidaceae bacterium]